MDLTAFTDLPSPILLRALLKTMAMLDTILSDDTGEPTCTFSEKWARNRSVGVFNDGQGNDLFFLFDRDWCIAKGTIHDTPIENSADFRSRLLRAVPSDIYSRLDDPAFQRDAATLFAWHLGEEEPWRSTLENINDVEVGELDLLSFIKTSPQCYKDWAEENYECDVDLNIVTQFYNHTPLNKDMMLSLNPLAKIANIQQAAVKIGYTLT